MTRNRVRKHRKLKETKETYQRAVNQEIRRMNEIDSNNVLANQNIGHGPSDASCSADESQHHGENVNDFSAEIQLWAIKHCITKRAVNDLLSILIMYGFTFLPKDSRTLMKTPVNVEIIQLSNGQLWYHGIQPYLKRIFQNMKSNITVTLNSNFDGVELFQSSKKVFWPIILSMTGKFYTYSNCIHILIMEILYQQKEVTTNVPFCLSMDIIYESYDCDRLHSF